MSFDPERFREQFHQADLGLHVPDRSGLVTATSDGTAHDVLSSGAAAELGLQEIIIDRDTLPAILGRVVVMNNTELGALSPAVVTQPDPAEPHVAQVTMLSRETFIPQRGLTRGQQFGVSAKAQTRVSGFGSDESTVAEEPGHFGVLMLGARNQAVANALAMRGDTATHQILDNPVGGLPESMASQGLVDLGARTRQVDFSNPRVRMKAFWHPDTMQVEDGVPLRADYPNSTEILLGAGVQAIGPAGVQAARGLVGHLRGRRSF